jgi:GntR family transcriptional repressor for pyruvate dehydrogenase complex
MVELVERQLWEYILASRLVPGQKLPSENELSVKLGVGRRAIRKGLKTLEAVGTIHQGFRSRVLLCEVEEALKTDR